jgi:hypothetical protein
VEEDYQTALYFLVAYLLVKNFQMKEISQRSYIRALSFSGHYSYHFLKSVAPKAITITKPIMKMKNNTLATDAAPSAIPPNPNIAAIMAMIKNIAAQRNIVEIV